MRMSCGFVRTGRVYDSSTMSTGIQPQGTRSGMMPLLIPSDPGALSPHHRLEIGHCLPDFSICFQRPPLASS